MRKTVWIILLLLLLRAPVYAEEPGLDVSEVERALPQEAREISGALEADGSYRVEGAIERLLQRLKTEAIEGLRSELKALTALIVIACLGAAAETLAGGRCAELISLCTCAAVTLAVTGSVDSLASEMTEALASLNDYARAALPAVYSAAAISGAVVSAGAKYAAVCLGLNVMMDVLRRLTLPLIYAYLALAVSRSVFPNAVLSAVTGAVKWTAVTVMTVMTMGVNAYIALTSALTGPADAAAVKGAKAVISGTLPVVGGILSDAASAVLSSAAVIKNAAGVFALIAVCALCVAPVAAIGVKMLLFRACAAVASALDGRRLAGLLGDLAAALGMMLGVLGCTAIMLFVAFMAAIRTVSA